jgi:tRNA U34 5-carboxymethylaminomethyl modifying GTPase MnmE/TrmE
MSVATENDSNKKTLIVGPPSVGKSIIRYLLVGNFKTFSQSTSELTIKSGKELETIEQIYAMAPQLERIIYVTSKEYSFEDFCVHFNLLLQKLSDFKETINYLVLINKVDLMSDLEAEQLKLKILIEFVNRCNMDVQFSSFKDQYLFETLKVIVNILQNQNYEENTMVLMIYYEKEYGIIKCALENNGITKEEYCKKF